jgi:hypothetical protein
VSGSLEYAQARIQARHGARPAEGAWAPLHAAVTLASLLEAARAGALKPWVAGLDAAAGAPPLEHRLREALRAHIEEVATWMPSAWQPALRWTTELIPPSPLGPGGGIHTAETREAWLARWRALWPSGGDDDEHAMRSLVEAVESHLAHFARAPLDEAWPLRRALQARIERLFRRFALTPAAAFAHLLLVALDLERLRAEIVARAAFAPP